ncbi:MAG: hypothetical protein KatS3mg040_0271 [Candidatus Kapaibacterium sp.]|nr:MAG: hypothetical protein KatS3mg040_0271 [Candidatus Kapabacteria bacterium]
MRSMCLFLCVLLAGGAVQAQDSSDVLWAKYAYEPLWPNYLPPGDDGDVQQLGVYWHWSDSVLIVSDLVQGEHRVFEIDVRRGVAVREVEELRGKGVLAVLPDTPIVYTRVPYFGKADYRTGRLLDTLRDVPPQGFRAVLVNVVRRQLLGWEEVVGNGVSSSGAARLLLYSLDSMRLVDTIPIPRHLPYGLQAGVPVWEQHYLEFGGWSWPGSGKYLHLFLLEHWYKLSYPKWGGYEDTSIVTNPWLVDIQGRRIERQFPYWIGSLSGTSDGRLYVGIGSKDRSKGSGNEFMVYDSNMVLVRSFPNGGVLSFALSPDGRYVMGGTKAIYHVAPSIWDVETGERVYQYSRPWGITNVSYSPSGKYIVDYSNISLVLYLAQPVSGVLEGSERAGILYPNPSSGVVVVGGIEVGVPTQVELYDVHGRLQEVLYRGVPSEGEVMVTVGRGVRGMYVLRVVQGRVVRWYTMVKE